MGPPFRRRYRNDSSIARTGEEVSAAHNSATNCATTPATIRDYICAVYCHCRAIGNHSDASLTRAARVELACGWPSPDLSGALTMIRECSRGISNARATGLQRDLKRRRPARRRRCERNRTHASATCPQFVRTASGRGADAPGDAPVTFA